MVVLAAVARIMSPAGIAKHWHLLGVGLAGRTPADSIPGQLTGGEDMSAIDRITMTPGVCGGRPCIRGLRIRVKDVLDLLAAGATREEILADYPYLEGEDITAALEFAAR
jgi:uncharacterized protein (DUF433 family)